ncbi:MAG: dienelactone hydrolase family protein [Oscillospiraceae bacterium]|nr:dienelactone hydrolase family protein [Oscillospiraceae bacterium]
MTFRERTLSHIGIFPEVVPLEINIESEKVFDGYTGYVISYNLEKNERVRSVLLVPAGSTVMKYPAILAIHQHNGEYHLGKAEPAGWDINGKLSNLNPMYAYGFDFVKRGYVVICPDLLCFEERCCLHFDKSHNPGADYEIFEFTKRVQNGSSLLAKYLHDMSVAVDVLCKQENVDNSRLGVIGHSLGGQTSLYMTWYDKRLKVGVSSCGFGTIETIIRDKINHNKAMYIPGFSTYADTYDILCDIAPRAFAFTAGIGDIIFPIDGVREIAEKAEKIYAESGVSDKLLTYIFESGHSFDDDAKEKVYSFIDNELLGG